MKQVVVGIVSCQSRKDEAEYLLVSSVKDSGEYTGYYYPPGGHVEKGEDIETALVREIDEELSLKAHITRRLTTTPGDVPNQETHWYECTVEGEMIISPELKDARYFTRTEIETGKVWPATQKVFRDYIFFPDSPAPADPRRQTTPPSAKPD